MPWRKKITLSEHMKKLATLLPASLLKQHYLPLFYSLVADPTAEVREHAASCTVSFLKAFVGEGSEENTQEFVGRIKEFANGAKYFERQT